MDIYLSKDEKASILSVLDWHKSQQALNPYPDPIFLPR